MLVNGNAVLEKALKEGYAVPAYNINNLEWTRYILETCQEDKSPVILAVTEKSIDYFGGVNVVHNVVKSLINSLNITIPVVLHLDHGKSISICRRAIDSGFTSVMLDASEKSFEENVRDTNEVIEYAKEKSVSVEAEIGSMNKEEGKKLVLGSKTTIDEAKDFYLQTGVDFLAPSVGNMHGIYKEKPNIDFDLLGLICKEVKIPLVLHGASGLDENMIKAAIFCGVSKININTDLMCVWAKSVRDYLNYDKEEYDPRKIISAGENELKKLVHEKNRLFGSINQAN